MARPPATIPERVIANCRPQPAIPALLVLVFTVMLAGSAGGASGGVTWTTWAVVAGLLTSCGLAIAAGFCSFFPPVAWLAVAYLGLGTIGRLPGAAYARAAIVAGMAAAVAMLLVQAWRVKTGRFVPTIDEPAEPG